MQRNRLNNGILTRLIVLPGMCIVLFIAGCAAKMETVNERVVELPGSFTRSGESDLAGKWWLSFDDDQLSSLIELALSDNFSLKTSWDRLTQARALYRKSGADRFPVLDGEAGAAHSIDRVDGATTKSDKVSLGLSTSYEVDLWGRIESGVEAARMDMEGSTADLDAAAMTLAAEVAGTWYLLVQQSTSLDLLDQQIGTNTKALQLISAQFRTGQVPLADVLQQRQLVESQQGDRMQQVANRGQTVHKLAVLLGRVPGSITPEVPRQLVGLPELPSTGIPAEFIRSRPDIRSAFLALQAADKRVAVAVADQYPALRLSASLDTLTSPTANMFSDYLASVMAGLTAPLFDGGTRKAEVERTRGAAAEKLHDYGQTVLSAVGEVEDALLKERQQQQYILSLDAQLELATRTMDQVKDRYLKGVENYQRVLTALISLQSLQQSRITAQKDLLLNRIELCRALGRGWDYSRTTDHTLTSLDIHEINYPEKSI